MITDNISKILKELVHENGLKEGLTIDLDNGGEVIAGPLCSGEAAYPGDKTVEMVKHTFKTNKVVSLYGILSKIKVIKDDEDIRRLRIANEIGRSACNYICDTIRKLRKPFMREIDVVADPVKEAVVPKANLLF